MYVCLSQDIVHLSFQLIPFAAGFRVRGKKEEVDGVRCAAVTAKIDTQRLFEETEATVGMRYIVPDNL